MRSMYKPNISATGRLVSTFAGAALAAAGCQRSNRALGLLGLGLIGRGASGWCPLTAATERDTRYSGDTRRHLGGARGVIVEDAITIYRPIDEVYAYWRSLESLPNFMDHLEEVHVLDGYHSHWVARGPLGVRVEWDAEIINDIPPTLLSWKSTGDSDVIRGEFFSSLSPHPSSLHSSKLPRLCRPPAAIPARRAAGRAAAARRGSAG